jgi:hypothetical protein
MSFSLLIRKRAIHGKEEGRKKNEIMSNCNLKWCSELNYFSEFTKTTNTKDWETFKTILQIFIAPKWKTLLRFASFSRITLLFDSFWTCQLVFNTWSRWRKATEMSYHRLRWFPLPVFFHQQIIFITCHERF